MQTRKASIKETGEELTTAEWERFDAAVAELKAERKPAPPITDRGADVQEKTVPQAVA